MATPNFENNQLVYTFTNVCWTHGCLWLCGVKKNNKKNNKKIARISGSLLKKFRKLVIYLLGELRHILNHSSSAVWYFEALKFLWEFRRTKRSLLARGIGELDRKMLLYWLVINRYNDFTYWHPMLRIKGKTEVKNLERACFPREIGPFILGE